ncbi:hypothetical protein P167DRAFT_363550 [Morchella conica CCBAS932]|uniref:Uncharacterized protein n=1 Tax=Morchella conica CCBAS932 TaxID=1392247 RepID=A0A3N4KCC9_9PEZI|nr:hypothetical protein P167DRAFT_363550 [Morchella conica CCBAS932]
MLTLHGPEVPTAAGRRNPCTAVVTLRPHTHTYKHTHSPYALLLARFPKFHSPLPDPCQCPFVLSFASVFAASAGPLFCCACCNLPATRCSVLLPAFLPSGTSLGAFFSFSLFFLFSFSFLFFFTYSPTYIVRVPFSPGELPSPSLSNHYQFINFFLTLSSRNYPLFQPHRRPIIAITLLSGNG